MRAAGVEPRVDTAYAQMKEWHTFYQVEDLLIVIDEGISAAQELITRCDNADDLKKLSESVQKLANTRLLLEGKSTQITEKREVSKEDSEFEQALREFQSRTVGIPRGETADDLV
jgi:predicted RND superfamily exporter protein